MRLYRFYLGLDTNGANIDARDVAYSLAANCFPHGHTIYEANGRWIGEVGIIDEPTLIVEWMASDERIATGNAHRMAQFFAGAYKDEANQESVLVTQQDIEATFV